MIGRLLCWIGEHAWYEDTQIEGVRFRYYQCRRCAAWRREDR